MVTDVVLLCWFICLLLLFWYFGAEGLKRFLSFCCCILYLCGYILWCGVCIAYYRARMALCSGLLWLLRDT